MKATVLMYNLKDTKKGKQISMIFAFLGFKVRHVLPGEYGQPVGILAGVETKETAETKQPGEVFTDEMLVMHPASEDQLNQALFLLRKEKLEVGLKAMITPSNKEWNSYQLHDEIAEEHRQMHGET